ncbi:7TM-DISM domain-containing protein [Bacteriovoracales bacterium]|nr:7TM-DISM domain-containing protein [Bacteriovoracales bacterium]
MLLNKMNFKNIFKVLLLLKILIILSPSSNLMSKIIEGVLNLETHKFQEGAISLEGNWLFFHNQFLDPKKLINEEILSKGIKIKVPGAWRKQNIQGLDRFGYGSYLLKVKGIKKKMDFALKVKDVGTSYKIFIIENNKIKMLGGLGRPGEKKETSNPKYGTFFSDFLIKEKSFFILIHISNFHHRDGGLTNTIKLGEKNNLRDEIEGMKYKSFFTLGIFLIMGINHIIIFFQRREDKGSFWFSIFCFVIVIRFLSLDSYLGTLFFPPGPLAFSFNYKFRFLTFFLIVPIFWNFLNFLFDKFFHDNLLKGFWIISLSFSSITIIAPVYIFTELTEFFQVIILLSSAYMIIQLTRASLKSVTYANICLAGIVFSVFGVVWDLLIVNKILPPPQISLFTVAIFILIQSYIISKKFSNAYKTAENLNIKLEDKVQKRTKEISGLLNNLESAIFSVKKDLKVIPPFSQYSETLFKKNIEGKNIFDFLFFNIEKESRKYTQANLSFQSIFNDDELNYSFIEVNFPQDVILSDTERPEGRKLKISYSPIYDKNNLVERLMFIVEDITEFEKFYQEAQMDQLSYNFIKEVLTIEEKDKLAGILENSIKSGFETLEDLLSPKSETAGNEHFLKIYKAIIEKITSDVKIMPILNKKIHIKTADFDYISLMGEQDYGGKKVEEETNYQLEVTDKINDIIDYLLIYDNVVKLFHSEPSKYPFEDSIQEKVQDLKLLLTGLFEKTFLIQDTNKIDKVSLAKIANLAKSYTDFDKKIGHIQQKTKFISLLLKANKKEEASKNFSTLANLFKQMPPQNKINETSLNQNLILPYKEILNIELS